MKFLINGTDYGDVDILDLTSDQVAASLPSGGSMGIRVGPNSIWYPAGVLVPASNEYPFPGKPRFTEVHTLTVTATGGTFTVTFRGASTAALAYNVSAADLQTALLGLSTIGDSDLTVASSVAGTYTITWKVCPGDMPTLGTGSLTGGSATIVVTSLFQPSGWYDGYDLGGVAFSYTEQQKGALSMMVPGDWEDPDVHIIGLSHDFSSGTVRFHHAASPSNAVNAEATPVAAVTFDGADIAWVETANPGVGDTYLSYTMAFVRECLHADDDLAANFCVIGVFVTNGAS